MAGTIILHDNTGGTLTLTSVNGGLQLTSSTGTTTISSTSGIILKSSGGLQFSLSGNSSTGLAAVNGPFSAQGVSLNIVKKSGTYTALPNDDTIECTGGAAFTVTLPAAPNTGKVYIVKNATSPLATITIASTANIDGAASQTLTTANSRMGVQFDGTTYIIIFSP